MNLVKAPLRISYVGGGTDFPSFYSQNEGCGVIAAAIDQYVYIFSNPLSSIAKERIRFTYRETESVNEISELRHPVMRQMLQHCNYEHRTNFGTFSDLPSGVGLGGSSSFTVALAHLIMHTNTIQLNPEKLAKLAVHIERIALAEAGGVQDQYVAAFGGLRKYEFGIDNVKVSQHLQKYDHIEYLEKRQMLIWLEESRFSQVYAAVTEAEIKKSNSYLKDTIELFQDANVIFSTDQSPAQFFEKVKNAVRIGWTYKKKFTGELNESVKFIDKTLDKFSDIGFKLCGAGGSGFILVLAEPDVLEDIKNSLKGYKFIHPRISPNGSTVQDLF